MAWPGNVHKIGLKFAQGLGDTAAMAQKRNIEEEIVFQTQSGAAVGEFIGFICAVLLMFGDRSGVNGEEGVLAGAGEFVELAAGERDAVAS